MKARKGSGDVFSCCLETWHKGLILAAFTPLVQKSACSSATTLLGKHCRNRQIHPEGQKS